MLAEVKFSCGTTYLSVAGVALAVEGSKCWAMLLEEAYDSIPDSELASATIGGKPISELPRDVVRFFKPDNWTEKMLEYVAKKINEAAQVT